jgi:type I restriction enzyme S subunit
MMKIKLKKIAKVSSGSTAPKDNEFSENNGKPFIRAGHLEELCNGKSLMELPKIEESVAQNRKMVLVPENTILFAKSGMSILKNRVYKTTHEAYIVNHLAAIICSNEIEPDYLYYFFRANPPSRLVLDSSYPSIRLSDIGEIDIDLPSKTIQKKISKLLKQAEEIIFKRKAQIEALDQLTQSVFLEMFGDPVKNNKNWVMQKLSETGELKRGISKYRPRNAPELLNGPYPLIQTGDVANSGIFIKKYNQTYSELGLKQSKMWPKGTLCITIAANIAQTGILTFDACFPDSVVAYISKNYMSNIYVHFWFTFLQRIIEANAPESAQKNINLKILSELEIPVPPVELQNKFVEIVEKIESQKDLLQKSLEELENNFNSLMQRAFKGELFND